VGFILPIGYPCRGKWHFRWGLFYPYETPAGAKGILGGVYSIHTKPLPGQKAFWVGFILSIRNPCRGKRHFGWGLFYPYVTPAGANGIGGGDYSTHRIPLPGQRAFLLDFILSIRNPCRGKWLFGWVYSIHT